MARYCSEPHAGCSVVSACPAPRRSAVHPPVLPLTQLDDRLPAGDLDRRTVTLAFPQPAQIQDVLMQVVREHHSERRAGPDGCRILCRRAEICAGI